MEGIEIHKKFKPLFDLIAIPPEKNGIVDYSSIPDYIGNKDYYHSLSKVDTVVETSGRYGAKSFTTSIVVNEATIQYDAKTLYTRYTNKSLKDSVRAEFIENVTLLGYNKYYQFKEDRAVSKLDDTCEIVFKGIKPSSGNQTANLKSLKGFNILVIDESEEIPSYKVFRKIYYSIRSLNKRNVSILITNQTEEEHWINVEFFEKRGVDPYFNGIKDNVLYINTDYRDLKEYMLPSNILREYERLKVEEPEEYNNTIIGGWLPKGVGKVYGRSELKKFSLKDFNEELTEHTLSHLDPANTGTDNLCQVIVKIIGMNIYLVDVVFSPENTTYTEPIVIEKTRFNQVEHLWIETNGVGSMYASNIQPSLHYTTVIPYHQTSNKHAKIISKSGFIKKWVHFRSDYEPGSDYDLFLKNLLQYNKEKKLNNNIHDDAPDSLSSLIHFIDLYIGHIWK